MNFLTNTFLFKENSVFFQRKECKAKAAIFVLLDKPLPYLLPVSENENIFLQTYLEEERTQG